MHIGFLRKEEFNREGSGIDGGDSGDDLEFAKKRPGFGRFPRLIPLVTTGLVYESAPTIDIKASSNTIY